MIDIWHLFISGGSGVHPECTHLFNPQRLLQAMNLRWEPRSARRRNPSYTNSGGLAAAEAIASCVPPITMAMTTRKKWTTGGAMNLQRLHQWSAACNQRFCVGERRSCMGKHACPCPSTYAILGCCVSSGLILSCPGSIRVVYVCK